MPLFSVRFNQLGPSCFYRNTNTQKTQKQAQTIQKCTAHSLFFLNRLFVCISDHCPSFFTQHDLGENDTARPDNIWQYLLLIAYLQPRAKLSIKINYRLLYGYRIDKRSSWTQVCIHGIRLLEYIVTIPLLSLLCYTWTVLKTLHSKQSGILQWLLLRPKEKKRY